VLAEIGTITRFTPRTSWPRSRPAFDIGDTASGLRRTLMPGLIDAHAHIMFETVSQVAVLTSDIGFINVAAVKAANDMWMCGFTRHPRPGRCGLRAETRH
jgi:imidazolonepropionase-like amidohydrolase